MVANDDCSGRFFCRLLSCRLDTEKCPPLHSAAKHCLVERNQALSHLLSWIASINLLCSRTYLTQNTLHCLHPCSTGSTLLARLTCTNSPNTNHIHSNQPTNKRTPPTHISFKMSGTAETLWAVIKPKYHWEEAKRYWLNGYSSLFCLIVYDTLSDEVVGIWIIRIVISCFSLFSSDVLLFGTGCLCSWPKCPSPS